jgi:hypothetical protein
MDIPMNRPVRGSFNDRVYCDLVCGAKILRRRKLVVREICEKYSLTRRQVMRVYDRYIRPKRRAGVATQDLF